MHDVSHSSLNHLVLQQFQDLLLFVPGAFFKTHFYGSMDAREIFTCRETQVDVSQWRYQTQQQKWNENKYKPHLSFA